MEKRLILGIHIGSTGTEAALVEIDNSKYKVIKKSEHKPQGQNKKAIVNGVRDVVNEVIQDQPEDQIEGTGISTAGPVDNQKKFVHDPPNIKWANVDIESEFGIILPNPIFVDNDADAAALAEMQFGKGKNVDNFVCLMLCTGIGSGIIINRNIYRGYACLAGEVGHQTIDYNGALCNCGNHGCLEAYASGWAIVKKMNEIIEHGVSTSLAPKFNELSYQDICQAADNSDRVSVNVLRESGKYLGIGIANALNILAPDKIIITGKLSMGYKHFKDTLEEEIRIRAFPIASKILPTVITSFGDDMDVLAATATYLFQK
jgi:glucokinase